MHDQCEFDLNDRAQSVLKKLIRRYIEEGTPVGSRTLSKETDLSLSPATIRNVMADLEVMGLIHAPHTSAGRVPTEKGYRVFINSTLQVGSIDEKSLGEMAEQLAGGTDSNVILANATEMLSQITSFAGVVSLPSKRHVQLRQVEFLHLSGNRVLAILITQDGQVQNKVLNTRRKYNDSELVEAANYFNAKYSGQSLNGVREDLITHLHQDHKSMHREMRTAVRMAGQLFDQAEDEKAGSVLVSGENNFLSIPDFSELDTLRQLFDTFKTKQVLFDLLQKSMFADGVKIFIGEESGYRLFKDCSVIAAPYEIDRRRVGVLGVIGPTRMQYDEVISAVDVTAKLLGSALSTQAHVI